MEHALDMMIEELEQGETRGEPKTEPMLAQQSIFHTSKQILQLIQIHFQQIIVVFINIIIRFLQCWLHPLFIEI